MTTHTIRCAAHNGVAVRLTDDGIIEVIEDDFAARVAARVGRDDPHMSWIAELAARAVDARRRLAAAQDVINGLQRELEAHLADVAPDECQDAENAWLERNSRRWDEASWALVHAEHDFATLTAAVQVVAGQLELADVDHRISGRVRTALTRL